MQPFYPLISHPHLLTIVANFWRRPLDVRRFPVRSVLYRTAPDVQVLVHTQSPGEPCLGDLVVLHGLEGSSEAPYMRSIAQAGLAAGFAVHRFNMRSMYHAGLTSDLLVVLREFERQGKAPAFLIGYSLGGNVILKLAGELGENAGGLIAGICAVSTPIDLAACVRQLGEGFNRVYEKRFLRKMKRRVGAGARTLPEFDDRITAPAFGFQSAAHYYASQSSNQFLESVRIPALLIQAKDDPLVPFGIFDHPALRRNPHLRLLAVAHGGHLGFISRQEPRFWETGVIVEWILEQRSRNRE